MENREKVLFPQNRHFEETMFPRLDAALLNATLQLLAASPTSLVREVVHSPNHNEASLDKMGSDVRHDLWSMMLIAVGFGIAVWVIVRLLHHLTTKKDALLNETSSIKMVESRTIGPRAKLLLVEIPGKRVLIAQTPTELRSLAEAPVVPSAEHPSETPNEI